MHPYNQQVNDICQLHCIVFMCSWDYYEQIRALAIGQGFAPILAVVFMFKVEAPVLKRAPTFCSKHSSLRLLLGCPLRTAKLTVPEQRVHVQKTLEAFRITPRQPEINREGDVSL